MPLFQQTFAAEADLRRQLDTIKRDLDKRQLAEIERTDGRKYHGHLRSYLLAAKELINLLPESAEAPPLEAAKYKPKYAEVEETYNAFQTFTSEHPEDAKKIMLGGMVESAVKDFYTASKFLRRTLAQKYNELINRTNNLR